ncbi:MAG TPA: ABC transporter substrate-binding protein [Candidatus Binatia bacterium]
MYYFKVVPALIAAAAICWSSPASSQTPKKVIVGLAGSGGGVDLLHVTKRIGAFKRQGLDVDLVLFQGGSQALQALIAGEVKMISGGGGSAAQQARIKGAGNVLVSTYTPTMPYSLYVNPRIKSAKDLKGGKLAVSRFGSSSEFAARFMLKGLGLDPAKDVTLMQIGNQQGRFSALVSGVVDGAVIDSPNTLLAKRQGFVQLTDASTLGLVYPHNNMATIDSFNRAEPETVRAFLRGFIEGIAFYKTRKSETIPLIKEFLRLNDDAIAEESYDYFSRVTPAKPYPSLEGIRTVLGEMAATNPAAKSMKPEFFVDASFVKQLDDSGFIDKLYQKH